MSNNLIWAADKSFDIGCKVIKWDESGGFNFAPLRKYNLRNCNYEKLKNILTQFTVHWSATYRAQHTFQGLIARGYSVNFIIDDNDINGYASIYQCLDLKHAGWSQGDGFNDLGAGVEISYQPTAWEQDMYDSNDQKKWNVPPHETITAPIHGTKMRVHLPTQAQMNSLIQLIWGYCELFPKVKPEFPKNKNQYITTVLNNPQSYQGLVNHYHLKRGKIDTAGLDMKKIEEEIAKRRRTGY
jgi:hypothetical protein